MKRECLNHFFRVSVKHLDHIVQTDVDYCDRFHPHQGKGNRPLTMQTDAPIPIRATKSPPGPEQTGAVQRHGLLGGLLSHDAKNAA
ncbi:MAG: hypothetical protein WDZ31_09845 [Phycisphaeraceae bacterium]